MRSIKIFLLAALFAFPVTAFAQEAALPPAEVPQWLEQGVMVLVGLLNGIPVVGHVLSIVFQVLGILAALMTATSVFAQSVLMALSGAFKAAGLDGIAAKIKAVEAKVMPWLKWLSMFNVQKKS